MLEKQDRDRKKIEGELKDGTFTGLYWDARLFGNTFLEKGLEKYAEKAIKTGVAQFGMGISVAPIEIRRFTFTGKQSVQEDKTRSMAPLGYRVVQHGAYTMPFFVNSTAASKSGCSQVDIELMKKVIPYAYSHNPSLIRTQVYLRHAWYVTHKSALGSCPDWLLIEALTPKKKCDPDKASTSWEPDYNVPPGLPEDLLKRVESCVDLAIL